MADFTQVVSTRRIIVTVGSGGVGKTTTAAAIAVHAARSGRRALVMTIDPAKRLANSLGLATLDNAPQEVPREALALGGDLATVKGTLHAMMLDQKAAFDEVVAQHAANPEQIKRILANPIYQQISSSLAGSQEYAAMAKLYAVDKQARFDLIVVDTPPTANALDFLEAPEKITDAVDSPAIAWFMRTGGKGLGLGASFVLKRLAKFTGSGFLDDVSKFFTEFQSVLAAFKERARNVHALMRDPKVGFVLVTSPEPMAMDEALMFHDKLQAAQMPTVAFVINRVYPTPGTAPARERAVAALAARPELAGMTAYDLTHAAGELELARVDAAARAEVDAVSIARLAERTGGRGLYLKVPFFRTDVHDVEALAQISARLFAG
ncbi:MAG: ArsA family ATPase [Deltaproteobacteria bacterium]|nr:ArsA family ATPase [Deltaproteobacteria bacterium]